MKKYFIHNPLFRVAAPAVYGVLLYLLILLIHNNVVEVKAIFSSEELYVVIVLSYLSIETCRFIIVFLPRFVKEGDSRIRGTVIQVLLTTIISVSVVTVSLLLYFDYMVGFSISTTQLWIFTILFTVTALLYNVLYLTNYYLNKENTLRLNAEKQQRQVLELEMMEFKNDINPDLLYESLENVIALMYKDVEQAEDYIDCLASTYRYVLANRQQELVSVSEEVTAARNVIKLLNEKYNGLIRFQSSLTETEFQALLIPGSLPMIIESLVRNTIINRFEPFLVQVYVEDEYITIQSKLNDKLMQHEASEHAFARLQKSYSLYSDLPMIKVKAYQENYIKLPIITLAEELN